MRMAGIHADRGSCSNHAVGSWHKGLRNHHVVAHLVRLLRYKLPVVGKAAERAHWWRPAGIDIGLHEGLAILHLSRSRDCSRIYGGLAHSRGGIRLCRIGVHHSVIIGSAEGNMGTMAVLSSVHRHGWKVWRLSRRHILSPVLEMEG